VDFDCSCSEFTYLSLIVGFTVEVLKQIGKTLGKQDSDFSADPCSRGKGWISQDLPEGQENAVTCNCSFNDNTVCHVTSMYVSYFLGKIFSSLGKDGNYKFMFWMLIFSLTNASGEGTSGGEFLVEWMGIINHDDIIILFTGSFLVLKLSN